MHSTLHNRDTALPAVADAQPDFDRRLFLTVVSVLTAFGILMVHSASITSWPTEFEQVYLSRQLAFLLFGVVVATAAGLAPARLWSGMAPWMFVASVLLLVALRFPGIGTTVNGSTRWLRLGTISIQPSEITKIALPLLVCRIVSSRPEHLKTLLRGWLCPLIPAAIVVPLVLIQPDLGTGAFLALGTCLALAYSGWPLRHFLLSAAVVSPACLSLLALKPYQLSRLKGFLAIWTNEGEVPYQLKQSLLALGAGGIEGVGLGRGWQKLSFLPEANTDFVMAVVGEELGLVGTLGLCLLWIAFYATGLRLLRHLPPGCFAHAAAVTLLTQLVVQAALNVAVVTAVVPPKGIPHPLLSYGGSNLVTSLLAVGIVVSLARADSTEQAH